MFDDLIWDEVVAAKFAVAVSALFAIHIVIGLFPYRLGRLRQPG